MKIWSFRSIAAGMVVVLVVAFTAAYGKEAARSAPPDAEAAAAMRQKISAPSRAHRKLDVFAGVWAARVSFWMDPSGPPEMSEGTFEQRWMFDGRFLQQTYRGELMGKPFTGLGYLGYDNYLKKYISTWMDSSGTTIYTRTGRFDSEGKTLTLMGEVDDYVRGRSIPVRDRMTVVSPTELLYETWEPGPDGQEVKVMEVRYTRKS